MLAKTKKLMVKVNLKAWKKLISKLIYLKKECLKKDKIIKAYEAEIKSIKDSFIGTKNV